MIIRGRQNGPTALQVRPFARPPPFSSTRLLPSDTSSRRSLRGREIGESVCAGWAGVSRLCDAFRVVRSVSGDASIGARAHGRVRRRTLTPQRFRLRFTSVTGSNSVCGSAALRSLLGALHRPMCERSTQRGVGRPHQRSRTEWTARSLQVCDACCAVKHVGFEEIEMRHVKTSGYSRLLPFSR